MDGLRMHSRYSIDGPLEGSLPDKPKPQTETDIHIFANILFPRSSTQNKLIATQTPATRYRFIFAALVPKRLIV